MSRKPQSLFMQYAALYTKRMALQKEVDSLKEKEDMVKDYLIGEMLTNNSTTLVENGFQVVLKTLTVPAVMDWEVFLDHVRKTGQLDLLHKRVTESAVKLRWEDGVTLPGVDKATKYSIVIKEL